MKSHDLDLPHGRKALRGNKHKRTPIPGLAHHIVCFNRKRTLKEELAAIRAAFADHVYAASQPERRIN